MPSLVIPQLVIQKGIYGSHQGHSTEYVLLVHSTITVHSVTHQALSCLGEDELTSIPTQQVY